MSNARRTAFLAAAAASAALLLLIRKGRAWHRLRDACASLRDRLSTQLATSAKYAAFISHFKEDAAMEARYLQTELEPLLRGRCFLDSDDLRDLRELTEQVRASQCLLLVQSKGVLSRPWVLIELFTALSHGVPVVGVALTGRPPVAYSFNQAEAYLASLPDELERCTPGGCALLEANGVEPLRAAWLLSCAVPNVVSVGLNVGASRNVLAATMSDIADAVRRAVRTPSTAHHPPFDEWVDSLRERSSLSLSRRSSGAEVATAAAGKALEAGAALLEAAKRAPHPVRRALQPLAYLVHAVHVGAGRAKHLRNDCALFAALVGQLEQSLADVDFAPRLYEAPLEPLEQLANVLDEAVDLLALFGHARIGADELNARYPPHGFDSLTSRLYAAAEDVGVGLSSVALPPRADAPFEESRVLDRTLRLRSDTATREVEGSPNGLERPLWPSASGAAPTDVADSATDAIDAAGTDFAAADATASLATGEVGVELPEVHGGPQHQTISRLRAELRRRRRQPGVSESRQRMLEVQNQLLSEQVAQMRALFEQQQTMMRSFMASFPLPVDEAERRLSVEAAGLDDILAGDARLAQLDQLLVEVLQGRRLGAHLLGMTLTILTKEAMRYLSFAWWPPQGFGYTELVTPASLPRSLIEELSGQPKKTGFCQYVVAADDCICTSVSQHGMSEFMQLAAAAAASDRWVAAKLHQQDGGGPTLLERLRDPSLGREADRLGLAVFGQLFAAGSILSGIPVRICGRPVGNFCCVYGGLPGDVVTDEQKAAQREYAERVSGVLDCLCPETSNRDFRGAPFVGSM